MAQPPIREPGDIRRDCARKLRLVRVSDHFQAMFRAFLGAADDLLRNIHGVAPVANLDGDDIGYLVGKVAEIKRRK
jgi:hypothetical protein